LKNRLSEQIAGINIFILFDTMLLTAQSSIHHYREDCTVEITMIHGQRHKGSTYHVAKSLADKIALAGTTVHEFFMPSDVPGFCVGCYGCILKGEEHCPHAAQVQPIVAAMCRSEVIILDSPTYCYEMTGQLKTLLDHFAYLWLSHRPRNEMFRKIGIVISTAAGAGAGVVTRSLARQLSWWGVSKIYRLKFTVSAATWQDVTEPVRQKIEVQTAAVARKILHRIGRVRTNGKIRFLFSIMRQMQKKNTWNMTDRNYWQGMKWLDEARPWQQV
jgi:multimeric flavodoxin WrbA